MKRGLLVVVLVGCGAGLAGCAGPTTPAQSPEQLSAIQTREINATREAAFRAAAGVMMDSGMVISMSDYAAGLVSGADWGYVGGVGEAHRTEWSGVLVWVRRAPGTGRSELRVSFGPGDTEERVSAFTAQVEERVQLMHLPERGTR